MLALDHGEAIGFYRGDPLYHASLDASEYQALLMDLGFKLIEHSINDPAKGSRIFWLARKSITSPFGTNRTIRTRPLYGRYGPDMARIAQFGSDCPKQIIKQAQNANISPAETLIAWNSEESKPSENQPSNWRMS